MTAQYLLWEVKYVDDFDKWNYSFLWLAYKEKKKLNRTKLFHSKK